MSQDLLCFAGFDGYFKRVNDSWERVLGYTPKELLAEPHLNLVHLEDRQATITELSALQTGRVMNSFESRYRCKDGSYRWLLWTAIAKPDEELIYAVARDNTERKLIDQQTQDTLRMRNDFVSFVTHQLRTPLSGIKWMLELAGEAGDPQETTSYIRDAHESADRLIGLVNDLLDASRLESGKLRVALELVPLRPLTNAVLDDLATLVHEKHHTVTVDSAPGAARCHQRSAVAAPGPDEPDLERDQIHAVRRGDLDPHGPGRTEPALVDPRQRHRDPAGVDRPAVREILSSRQRAHRGHRRNRPRAVPRPADRGTIRRHGGLRIGRGPRHDVHRDAAPDWSLRMTKTILLAEDDRFLRRAAETKLKQAGFDVRVAVDGEEALTFAREQAPDLMLLDLLMPKRDGLSVLKALKADTATSAIPIVIISNSSKDLEMQNASDLGAVDYWIKSNLSLQELCDRVQRLLGKPA